MTMRAHFCEINGRVLGGHAVTVRAHCCEIDGRVVWGAVRGAARVTVRARFCEIHSRVLGACSFLVQVLFAVWGVV